MGEDDHGLRRGQRVATIADVEGGPTVGDRELVDWWRLGRRVGLLALGWAGLGSVGAAVTAALLGGLHGSGALWVGVAAFGFFASALGAVALSAFGGMLRAGERGERLAGGDVGLVPPQVSTRRRASRRDRGAGEDA